MTVVFIAGASAAGKSKFTENLLAILRRLEINSLSINMDDYYKEIPVGADLVQYKQTTNFDDPNSLDLMLLKDHIINLENGKCIDKPVFDFKTERRITTELIAPPEVLLIEGTAAIFFAKHFLPNFQTSYKVFIEANQETVLKRRMDRDILERGYADKISILKKDADFVRPSYAALIEPTKKFADIIIDNNEIFNSSHKSHPLLESAERLARELKEKLL